MCSRPSLGSATFFAFLGGSPHVIVTLMDRTSAEYGVWFAISSIGYMAGNYLASRLSTQLGVDTLIWWGIAIEAIGVVAATVLAMFAHHLGPAIVFMPQMVVSLGNGLMLPGALAGAVSVRPQAAGHRRRHRRVCADGARRRDDAICRHAARRRHFGRADDAADGRDRGVLAVSFGLLVRRR